jgi:hypothetical protein
VTVVRLNGEEILHAVKLRSDVLVNVLMAQVIHALLELGSSGQVELLANGRKLLTTASMQESGLVDGSVVTAHLKPRPVFKPSFVEELRMDIGEFGQHVGTAGVKFLWGGMPASVDEAREILNVLHGDVDSSFHIYNEKPLLNACSCQCLKQMLDQKHLGEPDLQVLISPEELTAVIGETAFAKLCQLFDDRIDAIKLRRVDAHGNCINFHLDHSRRTMQVALNDDDEYSGGRLAFITWNGMQIPKRSVGSATIHDNTIVHGVTRMESGVRYGLFFQKTCA